MDIAAWILNIAAWILLAFFLVLLTMDTLLKLARSRGWKEGPREIPRLVRWPRISRPLPGSELFRKQDSGSVVLEVAFGMILLTSLLLGGLDMVFAASAKSAVQFIAESSARCTQVADCDPVGLAKSNASGLGLKPAQMAVEVSESTVKVKYEFAPLFGFFPSVALTATATEP